MVYWVISVVLLIVLVVLSVYVCRLWARSVVVSVLGSMVLVSA